MLLKSYRTTIQYIKYAASFGLVVVVKWSACSSFTLMIRVQILLKFFSINLCLKRTKINKKRPGLAHFYKEYAHMQFHIRYLFVCMCTCVRICLHVHLYVYTCTYMCTSLYLNMCTFVYVYL